MFYDHYFNGRYEDALAIIRQHPAQETWETQYKYLISYGQLGDLAAVADAHEKLTAINADWTVEEWSEVARIWNIPEVEIAKIADGLRKAGVPE